MGTAQGYGSASEQGRFKTTVDEFKSEKKIKILIPNHRGELKGTAAMVRKRPEHRRHLYSRHGGALTSESPLIIFLFFRSARREILTRGDLSDGGGNISRQTRSSSRENINILFFIVIYRDRITLSHPHIPNKTTGSGGGGEA